MPVDVLYAARSNMGETTSASAGLAIPIRVRRAIYHRSVAPDSIVTSALDRGTRSPRLHPRLGRGGHMNLMPG